MDALLTLAETATRLDVSRPYAVMLCDAGQLGEVTLECGRRRVRASAVEAYVAARAQEHEGAPSPRETGIAAGLYAHPDSHYRTSRPWPLEPT